MSFVSRSRPKISAIVPVYNEAKTVAAVIKVLLSSQYIDEVICVNDGSTDNSLTILKKFASAITLINLKKNQGKGYALAQGIVQAKGEIVTFFDADLTNLSEKHIKALLKPILTRQARAVLGYPKYGWYHPCIFANLTGERAYFKQDLLPHLKKMAKTRFGVEIFLNNLFANGQTKKIPLLKLRGLYKYEKHHPAVAFKEYVDEAIEMALELARIEELLPADFQAIAKLKEVANLEELKLKIKQIPNRKIKQYLEKYIIKYLHKARRWWQKQKY